MEEIIHYTSCPACDSQRINFLFEARDHTVSKQLFSIWECENCTLRFTQDVPAIGSIGKYYKSEDYVSHTNTRKGLVNTLYHKVRNHTLGLKLDLVKKLSGKSNGSLLDIGAGVGAFASFMKNAGWNVTALEPDTDAIRRAKQLYELELKPSEEIYQLPEKSYDVITLWHVLELVHDLHGYLNTFHRLLKPDGILVIAVPNYTSGDASGYKEFWAAYDVPRHLYHFSPGSMKKLLVAHGFGMRAVKPMWFDSFYVSLLSEQYKTGRQNIIPAFIRGGISNLKAMTGTERASSLIYVAGL